MASSVTLRVFRWSPDEAERFPAYRMAAAADTTVLDALVEMQCAHDPTLAFRYACRVGMCGSCAMVVNGRERWTCRTRLQSVGPGPITVRLLYHFPLLRDLVVDMTPYDALARCHGQGNCTEVCPMGLLPADSIRRLRRLAVSGLFGLSR